MRCYIAFLRQQIRALTLYRFEFFVKIIYGLIAMYGAHCLWTALYTQDPALLERSLPSTTTYAMLAMALDIVFYPSGDNSVDRYMSERVRSGSIDTDLLRPINFQVQQFFRNSSYVLAVTVILVLPACIVGILLLDMQLPASLTHMLAFVMSLVLAYLVLFSMNFLLGLVSMITLNIKHISWAYRSMIGLFSGKLIPLWIFPNEMQRIINLLPFRCVFDIPLNIYTGELQGSALLWQMLLQLFWGVLLWGSGQIAWQIIRKQLTVQGG